MAAEESLNKHFPLGQRDLRSWGWSSWIGRSPVRCQTRERGVSRPAGLVWETLGTCVCFRLLVPGVTKGCPVWKPIGSVGYFIGHPFVTPGIWMVSDLVVCNHFLMDPTDECDAFVETKHGRSNLWGGAGGSLFQYTLDLEPAVGPSCWTDRGRATS